MKENSWYIKIALGLIALSCAFYTTQIIIFHNQRDTYFYMLQDLAFVPINVLLVTLILDRLMKKREKQNLLDKMNMVIGVFFHEVGTDLMRIFGSFVPASAELHDVLQISGHWKDSDFDQISKKIVLKPEQIMVNDQNLAALKDFLVEKKEGLLHLLANPNLLEHDTFTDLLWAVFHLADELAHRSDLENLPPSDLNHLKVDIVRAYTMLIAQWAAYLKHLKKDYPHLYSLAVRTNPFNPKAEITVLDK